MKDYNKLDPLKYEKRHERTVSEYYQRKHWQPLIKEAIHSYCYGKRVLDLGSGTGIYTSEISSIAHSVIGVDISRVFVQYAKTKYEDIDFVIADSHNIPLKDNSIDVVVCIGMIDYTNRGNVLKEIYRILDSLGVCILHCFNKYSASRLFHEAVCKLLKKQISNKRIDLSYKEFARLLDKENFVIESYKAQDGLIWLPEQVARLVGLLLFSIIEYFFKLFPRNPFSNTMIFIASKRDI